MALGVLIKKLKNDSTEQTVLFSKQIIDVKSLDISKQSGTCPNCESHLFFDKDVSTLSVEATLAFTKNRSLALTCVNRHRYCSECDATKFEGGNRHCCPICFEQDLGMYPNVAGRRTPRALYYSGIDTGTVVGEYNSQNPKCLSCSEPLYTNNDKGLACLFGHRFCNLCMSSTDKCCPECYNESHGKISIPILFFQLP